MNWVFLFCVLGGAKIIKTGQNRELSRTFATLHGGGNTISCGEYEISFRKVNNIPKSDAVIYYGIGDLENPDLKELTGVKDIEEIDFTFNTGDSIVVAIPKDRGMVAKKDNGST